MHVTWDSVTVREQFCEVTSLLPSLHEFWKFGSLDWNGTLTWWAISIVLEFCFLGVFFLQLKLCKHQNHKILMNKSRPIMQFHCYVPQNNTEAYQKTLRSKASTVLMYWVIIHMQTPLTDSIDSTKLQPNSVGAVLCVHMCLPIDKPDLKVCVGNRILRHVTFVYVAFG